MNLIASWIIDYFYEITQITKKIVNFVDNNFALLALTIKEHIEKIHVNFVNGVPLDAKASIFGFGSFLTALTVFSIVYTVSDARFKFRLNTSIIPFKVLFYAAFLMGILSLSSDIWYSYKLPIPGLLSNQAVIQSILGFLNLLLVFWVLSCAFVKPPIFGKCNYKKFNIKVKEIIVNGVEKDLSMLAEELFRSVNNIIKYSKEFTVNADKNHPRLVDQNTDRNYLLYLIGNRKFCKQLIATSAITAIEIFIKMQLYNKYQLPIVEFVRNLTIEALINEDSIIYHEDHREKFGPILDDPDFSQILYGNYLLVESITPSIFYLPYKLFDSFSVAQLKAYARLALIFIASYMEHTKNQHRHSYSLINAIEQMTPSSAELNELTDADFWDRPSNTINKFKIKIDFAKDLLKLLDGFSVLSQIREQEKMDIYNLTAKLIFGIITSASFIKCQAYSAWYFQQNTVWDSFFGSFSESGEAAKIIQLEIKNLLNTELINLEKRFPSFPNWRSIRIIGYCLNVLGLSVGKPEDYAPGYQEFHDNIIIWIRKNFLKINEFSPGSAKEYLGANISFDKENNRLVKTNGIGLLTTLEYIELEKDYADQV